MRYAATLDGEPQVLEIIAPCFNSAAARLRHIDTEWVLESAEFDVCRSPDEVFVVAASLLARIHQLSTIYLYLFAPLGIRSVLTLDDTGNPIRRRIRESIDVNVFSSTGVQELSTLVGPDTLAAALLSRATTDQALAEALALVGSHPITWPQIYDVIEFFGGPEEMARAGLAPRHVTRRIRQTANHHRHLGSRKQNPLPATPPSLSEARAFSCDILKKWLAKRT